MKGLPASSHLIMLANVILIQRRFLPFCVTGNVEQ